MQYYSDKTQALYPDIKALTKAEKEYDLEQEKAMDLQREEEEKIANLKATREARAKEIEDAIKARDEAQTKVNELTNAFIRDYGSWHYTFKHSDIDGVIKDFFKFW